MMMLVQSKRFQRRFDRQVDSQNRWGNEDLGRSTRILGADREGKVRRPVGGVHDDCRVRRSPVAREKGSEGVK